MALSKERQRTLRFMTKKHTECILLVEDEQTTLKIYENTLRKAGYSVETANNGEKGLALAKEKDISLAVIDYTMPGMSGLELAEQLNTYASQTEFGYFPFIMATSIVQEEFIHASHNLGALGYLAKPIEPPQLIVQVKIALMQAKRFSVLNQRLDQREILGMAVGILMEKCGITSAAAQEKLRRDARATHSSLRDRATEVIKNADAHHDTSGLKPGDFATSRFIEQKIVPRTLKEVLRTLKNDKKSRKS